MTLASPAVPSNHSSASEPLSREDVVAAALRLTERDGIGALTMRHLGTELGVSHMAAYKHVPGKEALAEMAADAALGRVNRPSVDTDDWISYLRQNAMATWEGLAPFPWVSSFMALRRVSSPNAEAFTADALLVLGRSGFDRRVSLLIYGAFRDYVMGALTARATPPRRKRRSPKDRRGTSEGPEDLHADDYFRFGLERLLDGLQLTHGKGARA